MILNLLISFLNDTFKQIICDAVTLEVKEKITELEKEIQHSKTKVETLESAMENQAQYSRRNCLIIHGEAVKSDGKEDTDQTAIKIFSEKLGINMTKSNLDRSHRLRSLTANRPSPIIVNSLSYNLRNQVFQNTKKTKRLWSCNYRGSYTREKSLCQEINKASPTRFSAF